MDSLLNSAGLNNIDNMYPLELEYRGAKGIHIGNGIYKINDYLLLDFMDYLDDREEYGYIFYNEDDNDLVLYFTLGYNNFRKLREYCDALNNTTNKKYHTRLNMQALMNHGGMLYEK